MPTMRAAPSDERWRAQRWRTSSASEAITNRPSVPRQRDQTKRGVDCHIFHMIIGANTRMSQVKSGEGGCIRNLIDGASTTTMFREYRIPKGACFAGSGILNAGQKVIWSAANP